MSDRIDVIARELEEAMSGRHARSVGLFSIPEYPELEGDEGMWSSALEHLLTALRYLAPATLLTLFWGQQGFLFRILKFIDVSLRSIVFSSDKQKESVLNWLAEAGPIRVEHLDTVWRHGWIVCGVLDAALPGACAGHPAIRLSLKHAQTIADHYLAVEPVFTDQELESCDCLSRHQEWKLAHYLDRIRAALDKVPPPVSKPCSQRTSPDTSQFNLDYAARGGGLTAAQVNNKMHFKIYPTAQQALEPGEITILIKGPKDTYGMQILPPVLGKAQLIRQKMLNLNKEPHFTENVLPITQGATYLRSFGKNDIKKTYHIPKPKYDIQIEVETNPESIKVGYTVNLEGRYEISITSRGQNIVGSPFSVSASNNILPSLERESFCLEDGEEIDIVDVKNDKKVVLRIVDFVTEKMLLKEDGVLEKITDNEAKLLMSSNFKGKTCLKNKETLTELTNLSSETTYKEKLKEIVEKVKIMIRVCKILRTTLQKANRNQGHLGIPDIVNSTLSDPSLSPYLSGRKKRDTIVVPENISVSLQTEKQKFYHENRPNNETVEETDMEEDSLTPTNNVNVLLNKTEFSRSNPFLHELQKQSVVTEQDIEFYSAPPSGVFTSVDSDETDGVPIKIFVEEDDEPAPSFSPNNPFIEPEIIERPKTPILKIITGEVQNRSDSVYIDHTTELMNEEILNNNEFVNPLFVHRHDSAERSHDSITDFIIGAPVSLPPLIKAVSPEPQMDSIMITSEVHSYRDGDSGETDGREPNDSATPVMMSEKSLSSSTFHSIDSNTQESVEEDVIVKNEHAPNRIKRIISPKREMWDSAYVSIDDSNFSPDRNNNDSPNSDTNNKLKFSPTDDWAFKYEFNNLGPAEKELWETCTQLSSKAIKKPEESKVSRWETRINTFTPIQEESDKSITAGYKDLQENDPVTVAFAELQDVFQEYTTVSEQSSIHTCVDDKSTASMEVNNAIDMDYYAVESASGIVSDVMRPTNVKNEGQISEVQSYVTEFASVSQSLQQTKPRNKQPIDENFNNIVLEKKKFWDSKIREIEEIKNEQIKKRRLSSKSLRHNDSLSKRKGKQIVKNFLVAGEQSEKIASRKSSIDNRDNNDLLHGDTDKLEPKLVDKWKKFWDEKLENTEESPATCFPIKNQKNKSVYVEALQETSLQDPYIKKHEIKKDNDFEDEIIETTYTTIKQHVPEEAMFQAFETSPKRFFGTSRKQILNKIDAFLGKPSTDVDNNLPSEGGAGNERGIVSSRINMFHCITKVEQPLLKDNKNLLRHSSKGLDITKTTSLQHGVKQLHKAAAIESDVVEKDIVSNCISLFQNKSTEEPPRAVNMCRSRISSEASSTTRILSTESFLHNQVEPIQEEDIGKDTVKCLSNQRGNETKTYIPKALEEPLVVQSVLKELSKSMIEKATPPSISAIYRPTPNVQKPTPKHTLRKSSFSKSEMDIFTKTEHFDKNKDLDKYKSYDELPKINVKSFISKYETVTQAAHAEPKLLSRKSSRTSSITSEKFQKSLSPDLNVDKYPESTTPLPKVVETIAALDKKLVFTGSEAPPKAPPRKKRNSKTSSQESLDCRQSMESLEEYTKPETVTTSQPDEEKTYLSLSEMEIEIIDHSPDLLSEQTPEREIHPADYKSRFKIAKQYFQSLEELRADDLKPVKVNECEQLLNCQAESPDNERPKKRVKRNIKSNSMPSSELAKIWKQLQEAQGDTAEKNDSKLMKISEKFNVDDLFNDVVEGKLSRQGSLRGIPHKKAVLETFKSMENIADSKLSSYAIATSQLKDFAKENNIKNAQTYLTEYPYLPTTNPAMYHSRLDTKASGLISMKELKDRKPRRNSVPDMVFNTSFTFDV